MRSLSRQRCFNHASREAAARCPECGRCFCRECVTEHEDRVLCAPCVKKLARAPFTRRAAFVGLLRAVQVAAGILIVWTCFLLLGRSLLAIPSSFHDGTIWKPSWFEAE